MTELDEHYSQRSRASALRPSHFASRWNIDACGLAFMLVFLSFSQAVGSVIPTEWFLTTAVFDNQTQGTQFFNAPPSLPFSSSHTAILGTSTSKANYAFQLGANYVDYLITIQHNCVQQNGNEPDCRSGGSIDFTPRTDVFVNIDGFYAYNMTATPMQSGAGARIYRIGSPAVILFGAGGSANTLVNPPSGTIPLIASGIVPAGFHYQLFYASTISFLGGANVAATANGQIHFRVTEVPEPAVLAPLAFAALLVCRPRRISRSS